MQSAAENDLTAQQWAMQMFNVLTLDRLWTQRLNVDHMEPEDMRDAASIGQVLVDDWRNATDPTAYLFIREYVLSNLHKAERNTRGIELLRRFTDGKGDLQSTIKSNVYDLFAEHDRVADELKRKIDTLRNLEWTSGDLPDYVVKRVIIVTGIVLILMGLDPFATVLSFALSWPSPLPLGG